MTLAELSPRAQFRNHTPRLLFWVFVGIWLALAIKPHYRQDWLLENVVVVVALPLLVWSYRRLRLSNVCYTAMFIFLVLHEIGAHYTYSNVPYDRQAQNFCGFSIDENFGLSRNHFDRALHFLFGLLVTPAVVGIVAAASLRGVWRWLVPLSIMMSSCLLFELVEWGAALIFGGDLGVAYLGTQGDPWDAQQDMLLASLGSALMCMDARMPRAQDARERRRSVYRWASAATNRKQSYSER